MNSGAYHRCHGRVPAFTLLEMVFVLGLIVVIATMVVVNASTVETEKRLREAAGAVESMAKRARNLAVTQQRAYELTISGEGVSIAPQHPLNVSKDDWGQENEGEPGIVHEDIKAAKALDENVVYAIKRWGADEWVTIDGENKVVLTLGADGLVEPVEIRCSVGESWLVQRLHPLTAGVRDEEMSISKN